MNTRTLTILKPDCIRKGVIGDVISRIMNAHFEIMAMKMVKMDEKMAGEFYAIHKDKPFYDELIEFMTSGRCIPMVLQKENCIEDFRTLIGNFNPEKANYGTIRYMYGASPTKNIVHGSDSIETAKREISFFFTEKNLKEAGCCPGELN
ncbi:MAG: nucleoside-diphosphate kinase [Candidatus Zixiibacteriota bacterium]